MSGPSTEMTAEPAQMAPPMPRRRGLYLGPLKITPAVVSASRAGDPLFLSTIVALVVAVAVLACLLPTRRAVRVDPVVALRND